MKRVTATTAARGFSELLDEAERTGGAVVIERHGKAVATIGPPPAREGNGWRLLEVLAASPADPAWQRELDELRAWVGPPQDRWSE